MLSCSNNKKTYENKSLSEEINDLANLAERVGEIQEVKNRY